MSDKINKMFSLGNLPTSTVVSKMRTNREYLLSSYVADELNTYRTWASFPVPNDAYVPEYDKENNYKEKVDGNNGPGAPGVRSIFNKSGAVMLGGPKGFKYNVTDSSSDWRIANNVPLMDSPAVREKIRQNSDCSIKGLVAASEAGELGQSTYAYSDFMYCKYLGQVSNNYMITLRRFPLPVDDYISSVGVGSWRRQLSSHNNTSIGCMVTWMGTPGNDMSNILKYSFKMPYRFQNAQWEEMRGQDYDSGKGFLNAVAATFDSNYRKAYMEGSAGGIFNTYIGRHFGAGDQHYNLSEMQSWMNRNKVYGPVDTIKGTYMRGSDGLEFDQKISLQFDYELKSYNGINPRQAMLDLISNILNVTYSTGTFWGGGYRGYGAGPSNVFTNLNIFKAKGGATSFLDAFLQDSSNLLKSAGHTFDTKYKGSVINLLKSALNQIGGMLLGGWLNKLGRPAKVMVNSLLSPAPVGFWHVTIGNPHHPIMSIGNMIITNTTIEHYGPLGLDDFPTGLKVTVELERGKPRDIREIEKLYMHGNDRIYSSMGAEIQRMYECSKEYKGEKTYTKTVTVMSDDYNKYTKTNVERMSQESLQGMDAVWMKYFGTKDTESITIAAMEQENGSQRKNSKTASGDQRQGGTGSR